jgi:hypothetical protein
MAYDSLFQLGFINELLRRMPGPLAQQVEQFVQDQGFDNFLLGYLISPQATLVFMRGVEEALRNARRFPHRLAPARKLVLSRIQLGMEVRKCDG